MNTSNWMCTVHGQRGEGLPSCTECKRLGLAWTGLRCDAIALRAKAAATGDSQVHLDPTSPATATQVGGDHYSKMPIQPMVYSMENGLDACQHTAIKYISRFRDKGGVEDLRKAIHAIQMLIQFEEEKAQ